MILSLVTFSTLGLIAAAPVDPTCPGGQKNGEKFTEGSFVKKCSAEGKSNSVSIIGCLTSENIEFKIGKEVKENGWAFKCYAIGNGKVKMDMVKIGGNPIEPAVKGCEGGEYQKGQTYLSSNKRFLMKCIDDYGSASIDSCITDDGKEVKVGTELTSGGFKYQCNKDKDGSVKYEKEPTSGEKMAVKGCEKYAIGEKIITENKQFQFECNADGNVKFTYCLVYGGKAVPADSKRVIHGILCDCKTTADGSASLTKSRTAV